MDRISRLPNDVLCHIISFLPTKHAVATSILSQRWINLWSFLPIIDLDDSLYLNPSRKGSNPVLFIRFVDRVLSLNQSHTLVKFRLRLYMLHNYMQDLSWVNEIIQKVFSRNVVEVDLKLFVRFDMDDYCIKIPHSQSLKVLKANTRYLMLTLPAFPGCFPSLRVFDVKVALDKSNEWITNLFPCVPALEKLCLVGDLADNPGEFRFNIGGAALKHVEVELIIDDHDECDAMVVIDAPKLEYLRLQDGRMASYLVKNKPEIREVRLDVGSDGEFLEDADPTRFVRFIELLQGLVNAKSISVSANTLEVILLQKLNLPMLPYLEKLELEVYGSSWIRMLHWLESCPNLKALSLIIVTPAEEFEEVVTDVVPSCLSSHVKEIEIKRFEEVYEEEILRYLLYNAKVLDRFTIDSHVYIKDGILQ